MCLLIVPEHHGVRSAGESEEVIDPFLFHQPASKIEIRFVVLKRRIPAARSSPGACTPSQTHSTIALDLLVIRMYGAEAGLRLV